jgi:hypothetical protein
MAILSARVVRAGTAAAVLASALLLPVGSGLALQGSRASEYQVKAVFLFNFAQFVEWQAPEGEETRRAVIIGILGDDPFGRVLDETLRGEHLRARPFEARRYREGRDVGACDILFISRSEAGDIGAIIADLNNRPILTVSDADDFARRGGMIQFVTDKGRIRLRINLAAAQAARLTISSKLLRVAEIVGPVQR